MSPHSVFSDLCDSFLVLFFMTLRVLKNTGQLYVQHPTVWFCLIFFIIKLGLCWALGKEYYRCELSPSHNIILGVHGNYMASLVMLIFINWLRQCLQVTFSSLVTEVASFLITPFSVGMSYLSNTIKFICYSLYSMMRCSWHPWFVGWWLLLLLVCAFSYIK